MVNLTNSSINISGINIFLRIKYSVGVIYVFLGKNNYTIGTNI